MISMIADSNLMEVGGIEISEIQLTPQTQIADLKFKIKKREYNNYWLKRIWLNSRPTV